MSAVPSLIATDPDPDALRRECDALRDELAMLKTQLSPHFLFNTLNNLYGTALSERSPQTAERIEQLSGVMRYLLEEARAPFVSLRRELRFLDDYLNLQRIRLPERDSIQLKINVFWDERPGHITPLLIQPLMEQAFRQGISLQQPCLVEIDLRVMDGTLALTVRHSVQPNAGRPKTGGLLPVTEPGLNPVAFANRLARAYPNRHTFTTEEVDSVFSVYLTINL